ncbi:MAG: guanylate kinase [Candidatus Latescibacteria bacterium 4484_7]|nr:MAG: guanylate kinase [Candidatus Latescibacteria bacterium 4484_7]
MERRVGHPWGGGAIRIERHPFVVVISGPSGVGKSTVVERLLAIDKSLRLSISLTTREPRPGEVDGREYHFVSREEFMRVRDEGGFLEWAEVYGNYYGTKRSMVDELLNNGFNVLLEIDVQGGMSVRERMKDAAMIFLVPPSIDELVRRLDRRGTDSEEVIRRRFENAKREIEHFLEYDYIVVNEDIDECVKHVSLIIKAETLRVERADAEF